MIYCSLKQNTYYESSANTLNYKLVEGNNVIYFGHSIKNPKTGINKINITEIIKDYLSNNLEDDWNVLSNEDGYVYKQENAFKVFSLINEEIILETYKVLYDFVDLFSGTNKSLTTPVNGKLDPRMKLFWTAFNEVETEYDIYERYRDDYLTIEMLSSGTLTLDFYENGGPTPLPPPLTVYYRKNGSTWNTGVFGSTTISVNQGDKVEFKGNNSYYSSGTSMNFFSSTAKFNIYGNIMSLVYGDDFRGKTEIGPDAFANLLRGSLVVSAENLILPSTTLARYCYYCMFLYCTNLVAAPALPATTLAYGCYEGMFSNCESLVNAPALPATVLVSWCYDEMFEGCTSLVNAPALPATTLDSSCYREMFRDCTSLVNAPALPATELVDSCYRQMFQGCKSLVTAPELPATTLAVYCYYGMFYECTALVNAPALPASSLATTCYSQMFRGCISLNYVKCIAETNISAYNCRYWLDGVSGTGTFVKKQGVSWISGNSGIPEGWTVEEADE